MKKMLKVLLSALFVVAICGCKKKEEAAPKKGDEKPKAEQPAGGEEKPDAGGEEAPEEGS